VVSSVFGSSISETVEHMALVTVVVTETEKHYCGAVSEVYEPGGCRLSLV